MIQGGYRSKSIDFMILVFYCTVQFDLLLQFYNFKYSLSSDTKTQVINTVENIAI